MANDLSISIFEVIGSPLCVASKDGQRVHDRLSAALDKGVSVSLSFHNVDIVTSAFLNVAIGQLYGKFDERQVRKLLKVTDIEPDDVRLLRYVVDAAKLYFQDPERYRRSIEEELEN